MKEKKKDKNEKTRKKKKTMKGKKAINTSKATTAMKETSGDESSESTVLKCVHDSQDRLVKMEKQEKKRNKKKSSPSRWEEDGSGSSETWESNPEPVEEHPLHDFTIRKKERQLDQIRRAFMFIGYEIAELPLDDVRIAKLQKEVGKILKRVKTIKSIRKRSPMFIIHVITNIYPSVKIKSFIRTKRVYMMMMMMYACK